MFVESMTFEEIRKELDRDKATFLNKIHFHRMKLEKHMRQTNMNSLDKYYDYVSPRKNRWVYHFMMKSQKKSDFSVHQYAYYITRRSYAVVIYTAKQDRILFCTSHFFTRYFERGELEKDIVHEIIRKFLIESNQYVAQPLKEAAPGILQAFIQLKDGVGLGHIHSAFNIVEMRTFITNDMLKGDQIDISKKLEDQFKMLVVRKTAEE